MNGIPATASTSSRDAFRGERRRRRPVGIVAAGVAATMLFSGLTATPATAGTTSLPESATSARSVPVADAQDLEAGLEVIATIPDSALVSDEAFAKWKSENGHVAAGAGSPEARVAAAADPFQCGLGIGEFVLGNAFAAAKVLKIKKAIDAAGGVTKVAQKAVEAYDSARAAGKSRSVALGEAAEFAAENGGEAAQGLLLELFSAQQLVTKCFP